MREKKILYIDFGGLGDHLAFTTIPEVCYKNGYDLYLSSKSKFRDSQIFSLIWELNPFFKGITDEEPNCGHDGLTNLNDYDYNLSINRNYEIKMGFANTILENNSKYPILYYKPNQLEEYSDYILLDLNSVSVSDYDLNAIKTHLLNYKNEKFLLIEPTYSKSIINIDFLNGLNVTNIKTKNIFNYADLILSTKKFICLWSGSSVLSATIKNQYNNKLEIDCFKNFTNHKNFGTTDKTHFWYENITYIQA